MSGTLVVIAGPTASGKTHLSIQLAKALQCEIISADSRQFYKEINIGTAKPDTSEMQGIPHHFIDFISIKENYNAGKFESDVLGFLQKYFLRKNIVLMVGGSGLYINAVCNGMDKVPPSDETIRAKLNGELNEKGISFLLEKLKSLDKKYYDEVDKNNPHRIVRALEVCVVSGVSYSSFREKKSLTPTSPPNPLQRRGENFSIKAGDSRNFKIIKIGLEIPREELYRRINNRVDEMIKTGLVEEAEKLFQFRNLNALQTVGYEELFDYFEKKITMEKAIQQIKQNTRRFAKRQITWFRRDKEIKWFSEIDRFEKILVYLRSELC